MGFKEQLTRYKNGEATAEEIKAVEEELEKNELINEYLAEHILAGSELPQPPAGDAEAKKVRRAVNRRLAVTIVASVLLVAVLALLTVFVGLPMYDRAFYNPNEGYQNRFGTTQFLADVSAYTELHFPGMITGSAKAEPLGMGEYDIAIHQWNTFGGNDAFYRDRIVRGKAQNALYEFYHFPAINVFYDIGGASEKQDAASYSYYVEELKRLPETAWVSAYISFARDIDMQEFAALKQRYEGMNFRWVAVRVTDDHFFGTQIGFEPTGSGIVIEDLVPKEKYPAFELADCERGPNGYSPETLETHFKTLVQYLADRDAFIKALGEVNNIRPGVYYRGVLDYVNQNGVKSYGVLVHGHVGDILRFLDEDITNSVFVEDVKLSRLER